MKKLIILINTIFIVSCNVPSSDMNDRIKSINWNDSIKKDSIKKDTCTFCTKQSLYKLLCDSQLIQPKILVRQAVLETGNFTSNHYKLKHNLFGFSYDGINYLSFKSDNDCISYMKSWQKRKYDGSDYYEFLNELPYSQDSNYIKILKQINI